ncbi:MAG: hypothetical protein FD130_2574 [Halothiobacillaceae bacterium]|nr:MAG: hypothetical protein FD130_2574 [Halothiobacillaceae bacterium]
MTLLEIVHGQPYQMGKQIGPSLDIQRCPHVQDDP